MASRSKRLKYAVTQALASRQSRKIERASRGFPRSHRSSVGMHTDLASADKVWVPTEDRGNQKINRSFFNKARANGNLECSIGPV